MSTSNLSVVLLTWNEATNIDACLDSLAAQGRTDFEVIVVDAASPDGTADKVRARQRHFPVRLSLWRATRRIPIGWARNLGVALATSDKVAFLSADAEAEPGWVDAILDALDDVDMVFGRQVHDPHRWTLGAAVRGLRYHFPEGPTGDPLPYASNVAAGYTRQLLVEFPFDPGASAAEDLLLARRAVAAGYRANYAPNMVVRHHDVSGSREEMRKNVREGEGLGLYAKELGQPVPLLGWGALLVVSASMISVLPAAAAIALVGGVLWLPALRRVVRRRRHLPVRSLAYGFFASPLFDLAFLLNYVRGSFSRHTNHRRLQNMEVKT